MATPQHDLPGLNPNLPGDPAAAHPDFNLGQRYRYRVSRRRVDLAAGTIRADTAALALADVCQCLEYEWEIDPEVAVRIYSAAIPDRLLAEEWRETTPERSALGQPILRHHEKSYESAEELKAASAYWRET